MTFASVPIHHTARKQKNEDSKCDTMPTPDPVVSTNIIQDPGGLTVAEQRSDKNLTTMGDDGTATNASMDTMQE